MKKRGQVTFFIVLGILILFTLAFLSILSNLMPKKEEVFTSVEMVTTFVEQCVRKTMNDGILMTAMQGGFHRLPKKKARLWENDVPFFYGPGSVSFSHQQWEQQLADFLENRLSLCTQSFWVFAMHGIDITEKEKRASVMIRSGDVLVTLSYPLQITQGDVTKQVDQFTAIVPVRLLPLVRMVEAYTKQEKSTDLCISCLHELGQAYGIYVRVYPSEPRTLFYEFIDMNNVLGGNYLIFSFAEEY